MQRLFAVPVIWLFYQQAILTTAASSPLLGTKLQQDLGGVLFVYASKHHLAPSYSARLMLLLFVDYNAF